MLPNGIKRLVKLAVVPPISAVRRMRRRRQLSRELVHVTRDTLIRDLEALDLPQRAALLVHTSLKRLGFVEGGPASVVDALVEVVIRRRRGTLAMPCFSIDGTMYNTLSSGRMFDVASTPSNLGAVAGGTLVLSARSSLLGLNRWWQHSQARAAHFCWCAELRCRFRRCRTRRLTQIKVRLGEARQP